MSSIKSAGSNNDKNVPVTNQLQQVFNPRLGIENKEDGHTYFRGMRVSTVPNLSPEEREVTDKETSKTLSNAANKLLEAGESGSNVNAAANAPRYSALSGVRN